MAYPVLSRHSLDSRTPAIRWTFRRPFIASSTSTSPQTRVLELLACKSGTKTFLHEVGALLEDCIPHSHAWILKNHTHNKMDREFYASPANRFPGVEHAGSPPDPNELYALLSKLGPDPEIGNVKDHPLCHEIERTFHIESPAALLALSIRPRNSVPWGTLCILITDTAAKKSSDTSALLTDAKLWMKLAGTIAERRLLEERLQTMETRLDLATKAGGIGIFDWEISTGKVYWSPQQFEIYEADPSTFTPSYEEWAQKVFPEDLSDIEDIIRLTFKEYQRYFNTQHRFHSATGEMRWIQSLGEVVYDSDGVPMRLVGTTQDITKEIQSQKQIAEDRRRLELALEASELGFWDWYVPTGEVQFGGRWAHMLGYELSDIAPNVRAWEQLLHPDDRASVKEAVQRHLEGLEPIYETEHRLRHKNGSWVWVLDRGRVIERDEQGHALRAIGTQTNITVPREARERLREEDKRKDEFLATLAHELRNPLAPIRTGLAIIKRDPTSPAASHSLQILDRQLSHMVRLIDDLLDISRISLGRLTLKHEETSLRSIVEMAVEASRPAIDAAHHTLRMNLHPKEAIISCDPTRLAQTISNLLNNSAKYTPNGGLISVTTAVGIDSIAIAISDDGLGIPKEHQERVFEIFGQVNRTLERSQGGLGIGLALVRNLIALHGGTVDVYSPGIGKGSTFTINLPSTILRRHRPCNEVPLIETPTNHHRRVLIVDDNIDAAETLSMLAKILGHTTVVAVSGVDALEQVRNFHPEVIFLDIGLPGMSGIEVVKAIKGSRPSPVPYVVAVTGWGSEDMRRKAHEAGFDEHLTKPIEVSRLEQILGAEGPMVAERNEVVTPISLRDSPGSNSTR